MNLKGPIFCTFLGFNLRHWSPKMTYHWFEVEKTAAMCISMSSLLPLSGAADRTGCFHLPLEPLLWLADCTLRWRGAGVVGSEAGLVPAGWGWETSAIPNDIIRGRKYETRRFNNIFVSMDWVKGSQNDCFHTLRVPTDPFKKLLIVKAQKMYFTQYGPFRGNSADQIEDVWRFNGSLVKQEVLYLVNRKKPNGWLPSSWTVVLVFFLFFLSVFLYEYSIWCKRKLYYLSDFYKVMYIYTAGGIFVCTSVRRVLCLLFVWWLFVHRYNGLHWCTTFINLMTTHSSSGSTLSITHHSHVRGNLGFSVLPKDTSAWEVVETGSNRPPFRSISWPHAETNGTIWRHRMIIYSLLHNYLGTWWSDHTHLWNQDTVICNLECGSGL